MPKLLFIWRNQKCQTWRFYAKSTELAQKGLACYCIETMKKLYFQIMDMNEICQYWQGGQPGVGPDIGRSTSDLAAFPLSLQVLRRQVMIKYRIAKQPS